MPVTGAPLVAFDPQGMVFAIALESRFIRMYDCRSYEKVPSLHPQFTLSLVVLSMSGTLWKF